MGPTLTENDYKEPFTLQGNFSSEGLPAKKAQNEVKEKTTSSGPRNLGSPATDTVKQDTTPRKDAETDVTEREIEEAQYIASLQELIKDGDTDAKFEFGQFHFQNRDFAEARKWFEEIEEEDMQAKYQLAVMYYDGLGVKADYVRSNRFIKIGCHQALTCTTKTRCANLQSCFHSYCNPKKGMPFSKLSEHPD